MSENNNYDEFMESPEGKVLDYISTKYIGKPSPQNISEEEKKWGREAFQEFYDTLMENLAEGYDFADVVCKIAEKDMNNPDIFIGDKIAVDNFCKKIALYSMIAVNSAADNAIKDDVDFSLSSYASKIQFNAIDINVIGFIDNIKTGSISRYAAGVYEALSKSTDGIDWSDRGERDALLGDIHCVCKAAIDMVSIEKEMFKNKHVSKFVSKDKEKTRV